MLHSRARGSVRKAMSKTMVKDASGALMFNILTSGNAFDLGVLATKSNGICNINKIQSDGHVATFASAIGHSQTQIKNSIILEQTGDSSTCGLDNPSENAVQMCMPSSIKAIMTTHCPCEYDKCGTTARNANNELCVFSTVDTIDSSTICQPTTCGTGNQMCTVSGLTYSSTGIVGSTAAITTSVCGDGRLEAISTGSNKCSLVGSQAAQQGGVLLSNVMSAPTPNLANSMEHVVLPVDVYSKHTIPAGVRH